MAIEIRNLSITSKVVQRQGEPVAPAAPDGQAAVLPRSGGAPRREEWQAECRRLIAELLTLRGER